MAGVALTGDECKWAEYSSSDLEKRRGGGSAEGSTLDGSWKPGHTNSDSTRVGSLSGSAQVLDEGQRGLK
jgi:hypothetical protein